MTVTAGGLTVTTGGMTFAGVGTVTGAVSVTHTSATLASSFATTFSGGNALVGKIAAGVTTNPVMQLYEGTNALFQVIVTPHLFVPLAAQEVLYFPPFPLGACQRLRLHSQGWLAGVWRADIQRRVGHRSPRIDDGDHPC